MISPAFIKGHVALKNMVTVSYTRTCAYLQILSVTEKTALPAEHLVHGHNCVRSVIVEEKRATRQLLSNRVRHCYFSDFIGLPCATFYKAKSHHATKETADRLLEKIASRNVSDIGESDDEDDIPQEDVPRENCETQSSNKGKDGGDRSPLKKNTC